MWFNVGLYCHAPWRHMKGRSRDIYGAGAGDGLAQDISPHPGAMMNVDDQNRYQRTPALTVGTGGGVERMWGPCACPPRDATIVPHLPLMNRLASRTSTRPPPIPSSTPCPYRTVTGA